MPFPGRGRRFRTGLVALVFLAIISVSTVVGFYTDLLWYREVGFDEVFWKTLAYKVMLVVAFGLLFFLFSLINLLIVRRAVPIYRVPATNQDDPFERFRGAFLPYSRWIPVGISAFLALFFAFRMGPAWEEFLLALNPVAFGSDDPLFGRDLSFFMFRLPVYELLYGWLFSALVVTTLVVTGTYYLSGAIRPQAQIDRVSPQVKAHLSVLIGLIALLRAWGYRLNQFELLYSPRGVVSGASYTDVNAELPALKLLVAISIISAALFLINIRFRGWTLPLAAVGLWLLTSVLAAGAFPFIIQRFRVEPAELQRERPFIQRNIEATRAGFGLDTMEVRDFPAQPGITQEAVNENSNTLNNVRLWDPETLKAAYRQLQEIRTYYQFRDVDVDRYVIDGNRRQVMLSVRELDIETLQSPTWQNDHLVFTHGYGAVVSPTNETGGEGRPLLLLKDIPPETEFDTLRIDQGGVYFGENPITYSIVNTEQAELDYTELGRNKTVRYKGRAGVPLQNIMRRLAFAWKFRDVNLAISGLINPDSKIVYNRELRDRVHRAAPFLELDGDPYAVVANGRIFWMMDAYTVSNMYPYSQSLPFEEHSEMRGIAAGSPSIQGMNNYVRNSVKATIDSYDGTIKLYAWDTNDPLIQAWQKVFPDLFENRDEMPEQLRQHIRYPEDLFRIQSFVYQRYHMIDPTDFYQREDLWVIPEDPGRTVGPGTGQTAGPFDPYYVLMRLPDSDREEYVLILPMNPRNRPNMVALLMAKSDPDEFGKLIDFRFPKGDQTFGVGQIHSRINATEQISRTITLLNQSGSNVILGNLLVLPLGKSILYTQPLFLQATNNAIPELKYVIVASADRVQMAPTLDDAVTALLEGGGTVIAPPSEGAEEPGGPAQSTDELVREAMEHLNASEQAARNGDWAAYGRELQAAKETLSRALGGGTPSPSPSPGG
jgi:uncharacterized protein